MEKDGKINKKRTTRKKKTLGDNASDGSYAGINPASYKLGQIVNISYGGLVFKYIDKDDRRSVTQEKSIFLGSYGYYLGDTQAALDIPLLREMPLITIEEVDFNQISAEHLTKMRQMRMEFAELTFRQIFALDKFIRDNIGHKKFNSVQLTVE
ncbi:MAG: PilZ domain-containing protein [Desulfamplus sp.]|nr:PilZ domain-containing protein [Desulfamplus sp.]